jgi:hypothetical protein
LYRRRECVEVLLYCTIINYDIEFVVTLRQSDLHLFQAVILEGSASISTVISPLKPRGNFIYRWFYRAKEYKYCITAYLWVSCDSHIKNKTFPYSETAGSFHNRDGVFTARYGLTLYRIQCNLTSKEALPLFRRLVAEI